MCYELQCSKCGKTTWGGCGFHVQSVYKRIPEGQHCLCKGWPGVSSGADGSDDSKAASYWSRFLQGASDSTKCGPHSPRLYAQGAQGEGFLELRH
ncbi:hypothetical protein LguiA_006530 [Lonicera macranthoides]